MPVQATGLKAVAHGLNTMARRGVHKAQKLPDGDDGGSGKEFRRCLQRIIGRAMFRFNRSSTEFEVHKLGTECRRSFYRRSA